MKDSQALRQKIEETEAQLEYASKLVEFVGTQEFQKFLVQDFMTDGIETLLQDRVHPHKQDPDSRTRNERAMDGIAYFKGWLHNQMSMGEQAEANLPALREELLKAEAEEMGDQNDA